MPAASDLDPQLASLLSRERAAIVQLARSDADAATILSSSLSGYATVRRYYELRDQDVLPDSGPSSKKTLRPLERARAAATALIAVIESASDCIRGGLFDPEIESVVPVDGLLALLGEALPLLGQGKRIFTQAQIFSLLRVVEDLDTVSGRIKSEAESLVSAAMTAYRGNSPSNSGKLTRSKSQLSGSMSGSSWDMLASQSTMGKKGKNRDEVKRGWDWRTGLDAVVGAEVEGSEVTLVIRSALAAEVARGWGGALKW